LCTNLVEKTQDNTRSSLTRKVENATCEGDKRRLTRHARKHGDDICSCYARAVKNDVEGEGTPTEDDVASPSAAAAAAAAADG
jgi:hypothetical protein